MQLARLVPVAVAVPLVLGALGACFRDRAPAGTAPPAAAARFAAAAALAPDPLAFLPVDSQIVLGLDGAQVVRSPLWERVRDRVMQGLGGELDRFKAGCGYDPFAVLRSITVGLRVVGERPIGVMVIRGLERDKTLACLDTAWPARTPARLPGGYVRLEATDAGGVPAVLAFVDAATLVMTIGPDASPAQLDAALAAGVPLRKSRAFAELWALLDAKQALWFVVSGNVQQLADLAAIGARPQAILGSIGLASGLAGAFRVRFEAPEQAAQLAAMAQGQLGVVRAFADEIEVGSEGPDLTARISLSLQQLDTLLAMAGGALGGVSGP